ncbi:RNA polymerase sigma factor [Roseivirga sp. UBA1976]|uniref:RNA polymerase sigma factor n=1 Tax=Roseivirga sp. UBA1976 TaxID=1947386 RepID=UPI00257FF98D|nr:RNA polymerase sigma factor [Roseivirga sp. UBA1976]|tara:strand:+ start:1430 stop:1939 length:510 start_codon:yes stop_codon:yes gene_type:complete
MTEVQQKQIFESWLETHKGILFKVVRSYCEQEEDREDLFQEIAVNVWKSVSNFKNDCAVSTWVYRIALNQALKWKLKKSRDQNKADNGEVVRILQPAEEKPDQRLEWLYGQIQQLDEIDRSLCLLLLDGFSYKEMASIVGISENYVGVKINRIKKHLTEQSKKMLNNGI